VCCLDDARATENMIRDLLMGHPLVATLTIQKNSCFVTLENGDEFQIGRNEQGLKKKLPSGEWSGWYTLYNGITKDDAGQILKSLMHSSND